MSQTTTQSPSSKSSPPTKSATRRARLKPTKVFPTDRLTFEKQIGVLRGYAAASGPEHKGVSNADVARITNITPQTVSLNNAFLQDTGLVTRTSDGFVPAPEVFNFVHQLQWEPATAPHKLAPILRRSWFFQALESKLRFREMHSDEAITDLAGEATAGKEYRGRLELLLDYLTIAGLIQKENDTIRIGPTSHGETSSSSAAAQKTSPSSSSSSSASVARAEVTPKLATSTSVAFPSPTEGLLRFNVSIQVNMKELGDWEPNRISSFFNGIAQVLAAKSGVEHDAVSE